MGTVPSATFELPGGLILEGRRLGSAELRPFTGFEEEWLAEHDRTPNALAITHALENCVQRIQGETVTTELVRKLLVGDRDYLMLQLRRLTLGDRIKAVVRCPSCGSKADVSFDASDVPVESRAQSASTYTVDLGQTVRFRLPTGEDQEAVVKLPVEAAAEALFDRCLLDDGGVPLTPEQRNRVVEEMEKLAPKVEIDLDVVCPECEHSFVAPFDMAAFFFSEMRLRGRQLLREVHLLAFYYHWSETEILRLSRSRRRAYLDLLGEALSRD